LRDLSLGEAATIAGMIQSPARYAPDRHPKLARARRTPCSPRCCRDNSINADESRAPRTRQ
jgi:membrane peptidoglycan carboxypeptidase